MHVIPCLFGLAAIMFACGGIYLQDTASSEYHDKLVTLKQDYERTQERIDCERIAIQYKISKFEQESAVLQQHYVTAREDAFASLKQHLAAKLEQEKKQQQADERERLKKLEDDLTHKEQQALMVDAFKEKSKERIKELHAKRQTLNTGITTRTARLSSIPGEEAAWIAQNTESLNAAEIEIDTRLNEEMSTRYAKFSRYDRNVVKAGEGARQRKLLLKQHYEAENIKLAQQYQNETDALKGEIEDLKEQIGRIDNEIADTEAALVGMKEQQISGKAPEADPFSLIPAPYFSKIPEFKNELDQVLEANPAFRKKHTDYTIQSQVYRDMIPLMGLNMRQLDIKRAGEARNHEGNGAIEKERFEQRSSFIRRFSTTGAILSGLIFILCLFVNLRQAHLQSKR